jgi:hypothetical protein
MSDHLQQMLLNHLEYTLEHLSNKPQLGTRELEFSSEGVPRMIEHLSALQYCWNSSEYKARLVKVVGVWLLCFLPGGTSLSQFEDSHTRLSYSRTFD